MTASVSPALPVELGIIEGYYGRPWHWSDRARVVSCLAAHGYRFFLYAPKAATMLRRGWRDPVSSADLQELALFASHCRSQGMRFGVGLSPHEFDGSRDSPDWARLRARLALLDSVVGLDELAILFDDVRGDDPTLARRQAAVVDFAADCTRAAHLAVCPTYYSDDPVLDRVFGTRPVDYLQTLGRLLDPRVRIFWTGEEVCSREFGALHLRDVAQRVGRAPLLWDNYPVNDGQRMSQYLHLRGFTGRSASHAALISGHAINPSLQPTLACVPAITLAHRYRVGDERYAYGQALAQAAHDVLGEALGTAMIGDLIALQDLGLDRLGPQAEGLLERYRAFDHPGAREIVSWLEGAWRITDEIVRTQ